MLKKLTYILVFTICMFQKFPQKDITGYVIYKTKCKWLISFKKKKKKKKKIRQKIISVNH